MTELDDFFCFTATLLIVEEIIVAWVIDLVRRNHRFRKRNRHFQEAKPTHRQYAHGNSNQDAISIRPEWRAYRKGR